MLKFAIPSFLETLPCLEVLPTVIVELVRAYCAKEISIFHNGWLNTEDYGEWNHWNRGIPKLLKDAGLIVNENVMSHELIPHEDAPCSGIDFSLFGIDFGASAYSLYATATLYQNSYSGNLFTFHANNKAEFTHDMRELRLAFTKHQKQHAYTGMITFLGMLTQA